MQGMILFYLSQRSLVFYLSKRGTTWNYNLKVRIKDKLRWDFLMWNEKLSNYYFHNNKPDKNARKSIVEKKSLIKKEFCLLGMSLYFH